MKNIDKSTGQEKLQNKMCLLSAFPDNKKEPRTTKPMLSNGKKIKQQLRSKYPDPSIPRAEET